MSNKKDVFNVILTSKEAEVLKDTLKLVTTANWVSNKQREQAYDLLDKVKEYTK